MVTLHTIFVAVAAGCLIACAVRLARVIIRLPRRTWHRHLDKSSLAAGLFLIVAGIWLLADTRSAEKTHQMRYQRGAVVTPGQGYAASVAMTLVGAVTVGTVLVHSRVDSDQAAKSP